MLANTRVGEQHRGGVARMRRTDAADTVGGAQASSRRPTNPGSAAHQMTALGEVNSHMKNTLDTSMMNGNEIRAARSPGNRRENRRLLSEGCVLIPSNET